MTSGLEWPEWSVPIGGGLSPVEQFNSSSDPLGYVLFRPPQHSPRRVFNYNFPHPYTDITICHGAISITPRGTAKFGQLFLDGGVWQGSRILSEEWVEKFLARSVSVRNFHLGWAEDYGHLWWMIDYLAEGTTYSTFTALGQCGLEIRVVLQADMVAVFTVANYTVNQPCDKLMTRHTFLALGG
jgi:CubicO group peptidase (beta-lactamase class C family)